MQTESVQTAHLLPPSRWHQVFLCPAENPPQAPSLRQMFPSCCQVLSKMREMFSDCTLLLLISGQSAPRTRASALPLQDTASCSRSFPPHLGPATSQILT